MGRVQKSINSAKNPFQKRLNERTLNYRDSLKYE